MIKKKLSYKSIIKLLIFLLEPLKKREKVHIRRMMRGHHFLKKHNKLKNIDEIKRNLTRMNLGIENKFFDDFFFLKKNPKSIIIKHKLLMFLCGYNENLSIPILESIGYKYLSKSASIPVPFDLISNIEEKGFKVDKFKSFVKWRLLVVKEIIRGIAKGFSIYKNSSFKNSFNQKQSFAYFDSITKLCIPTNSNQYTLFDWYAKKYSKKTKIDYFAVDESLKDDSFNIRECDNNLQLKFYNPLKSTLTLGNKLKFTKWFLCLITFSLIDFIFGIGFRAFLLPDSIETKIFILGEKNQNLVHALFNNSRFFMRPLWTYEAEKKGTLISFYSYSTNDLLLLPHQSNLDYEWGWQSMNWPHYLVWEKFYKNFILKATSQKSQIEIVGPIWFSDFTDNKINSLCQSIKTSDKFTISVFDVSCRRESLLRSYGQEWCYHYPENSIKFWSTIISLAQKHKFRILIKPKRNDLFEKKLAHPVYAKYLNSLKSYKDVNLINADCSPYRLIKNSDLTISSPFSSPSIISDLNGISACYYDPFSLLHPSVNPYKKCPLIQSEVALEKWILNNYDLKKA